MDVINNNTPRASASRWGKKKRIKCSSTIGRDVGTKHRPRYPRSSVVVRFWQSMTTWRGGAVAVQWSTSLSPPHGTPAFGCSAVKSVSQSSVWLPLRAVRVVRVLTFLPEHVWWPCRRITCTNFARTARRLVLNNTIIIIVYRVETVVPVPLSISSRHCPKWSLWTRPLQHVSSSTSFCTVAVAATVSGRAVEHASRQVAVC